jgi:hypothetical protein
MKFIFERESERERQRGRETVIGRRKGRERKRGKESIYFVKLIDILFYTVVHGNIFLSTNCFSTQHW